MKLYQLILFCGVLFFQCSNENNSDENVTEEDAYDSFWSHNYSLTPDFSYSEDPEQRLDIYR